MVVKYVFMLVDYCDNCGCMKATFVTRLPTHISNNKATFPRTAVNNFLRPTRSTTMFNKPLPTFNANRREAIKLFQRTRPLIHGSDPCICHGFYESK